MKILVADDDRVSPRLMQGVLQKSRRTWFSRRKLTGVVGPLVEVTAWSGW